MKILVTGAAGFIGFHLVKRLVQRGDCVLGIDNLNDYYDVALKQARLRELEPYIHDASCFTSHQSPVTSPGSFTFIKMDISDRAAMEALFRDHAFDRVVHLAAQAGVRYSLENPHVYVQSNLVGFMNILEGCRRQWSEPGTRNLEPGKAAEDPRSPVPGSRHLVYASSSSVYGSNTKLPFSTSDNVDHPISLYAATKKSNELMAHAYSHLYGIPTTGLRFFTVYGPWGRPDMALFKFTKAIMNGETIDVYNEGKMRRDFTYIDDIVEGVVRVMDRIPEPGTRNVELGTAADVSESVIPSEVEGSLAYKGHTQAIPPRASLGRNDNKKLRAPYKIYNIGNNNPVELMDFIRAIEEATGKKAKMNFLPMQPGDVPATYADVDDLMRDAGFAPDTPVEVGIEQFVVWYRSYYAQYIG